MSDFVPYVGPAAGAGPDSRQSQFETNPIARDRHPDGEIEFTFEDFLDAINPLQHIPIVSWIYRAVTGDQISLAPRLLGGALLGGPLGVLLAGVQAAVEDMTGTAAEGGPVVALARSVFGGSDAKPAAPPLALAGASPDADRSANGAAGPVELHIEVTPAAGTATPVEPSRQIAPAAPFAPRPQPVNLPRPAVSRGAIVPRFDRTEAPPPRAPEPPSAADAAAPDWVANAMMRALDKYESARRLNRDDAAKVSTVQ